MGVTREDVRHVSSLARLRLGDADVDRMTADLNGILAHVDALAEAEHGSAPPAVDGSGGQVRAYAPLRPDSPAGEPLAIDPADFAPGWEDGFFTVPRLASHQGEAADDEEVAP